MSNDYNFESMLGFIVNDLVRAGIESDDVYIDKEEGQVLANYANPITLTVMFNTSGTWSLMYDVHEDGATQIWAYDSLSKAIEQFVNLYQIQTGERRA